MSMCIKRLLWHVHVRFDWTGSHRTGVAVLGCGIFLVNFCMKWLLWHVHVHFDCAGSHKTGVAVDTLHRDLARGLLQRSCQQSSCRELVQRFCQETSYRDLLQRSCQDTSYGDHLQRHRIEICCRDLAIRSLTEINRALLEILYRHLI